LQAQDDEHPKLLTLKIGCKVTQQEEIDYEKVDRMREAMTPVLRRHGYEIPGVADLCAIAALRAAMDYDRDVIAVRLVVE
jgi:hypothetical protein